jgi:hypothetical protein
LLSLQPGVTLRQYILLNKNKVMKKHTDIEPVEVFEGTSLQAGILKTMLESENIHAYLQDELMGNTFPWFTSPGGAGAVKVIISSKDITAARIVVDSFQDSLQKQ